MFIFLILLLLPPPPAASPASLLFPNFLFKWTHYLIPSPPPPPLLLPPPPPPLLLPPPPPPPPSALSRYQASDYFSRNIINQSGKYRLRSIHRNRRRDGEFQGGPLSVAIGLGIYLGLCVSLCVCVCVCVCWFLIGPVDMSGLSVGLWFAGQPCCIRLGAYSLRRPSLFDCLSSNILFSQLFPPSIPTCVCVCISIGSCFIRLNWLP